jgi:hypothetical protein
MAKKHMLRKTGSSAAETSAWPIRFVVHGFPTGVRWMALVCADALRGALRLDGGLSDDLR